MTPEQKSWIDGASYEELLRRWRPALCGDEIFFNETGVYYAEVMRRRREVALCFEDQQGGRLGAKKRRHNQAIRDWRGLT